MAYISRFRIIIHEPIRYTVRVFAVDAFAFNAVDFARSFVVTSLDTGENVIVVHDVRFAVHDWAAVKTRSEQIAGIYVTAGSDFGRAISGRIRVRRQSGLASHRKGNRVGERQLLVVGATQKPPDHFETFIIEFQFLR